MLAPLHLTVQQLAERWSTKESRLE